jgi:hypothetical protein
MAGTAEPVVDGDHAGRAVKGFASIADLEPDPRLPSARRP